MDDSDEVAYEFRFFVPTLGVPPRNLETWDAEHFFPVRDGSVKDPHQLISRR
jgi:hypothetical protein